ncbi:schwannomin-interacting protein 1 [Brachyhypopomus gauderio]|uniref:schwannomin-interacting protein 1 n=1 Tax=Brachyhypopomus gauderio TaxID=698409 RepID=UPI004041E077
MEEDVKSTDEPTLPRPRVEPDIQCTQQPFTQNQGSIMHWEDLSLRIAELEKQEEERKKKAECLSLTEESVLGLWPQLKDQSLHRTQWADGGDNGEHRFPFITSRFNSPKNLQLCFINNSESEEEDDHRASSRESPCDTHGCGPQSAGLKREVRAALSDLRNQLWAEQKEQQHLSCSGISVRRRTLTHSDLQNCSVLQLRALNSSLHGDIQDLSSELVKHLVVRDHLRTKQDALLLDVQDMTSL